VTFWAASRVRHLGPVVLAVLVVAQAVLWFAARPAGENTGSYVGQLAGVEAVLLLSLAIVLVSTLPSVDIYFDGIDKAMIWHRRLAITGIVLVLPHILQQFGNAWVRIADVALLYCLLALGLNIVVGYAGLLDLGYVAFFAIGAYLYALLSSPHLTDTFPAIKAMFPGGLHTPLLVVIGRARVVSPSGATHRLARTSSRTATSVRPSEVAVRLA
jgi:hypothetical protein